MASKACFPSSPSTTTTSSSLLPSPFQIFIFWCLNHALSQALRLLFNLQQNVQMFKLDLQKTEEPEIKWPTSAGSSKKQEFQKSIYFCFIDYAKAFDCVDHNKMWKNLKEMGIPDHLTCLLRNLYAGQEATVRTGHGTTDWFQIGKGVCQVCILSPCLHHEKCWTGRSTS